MALCQNNMLKKKVHDSTKLVILFHPFSLCMSDMKIRNGNIFMKFSGSIIYASFHNFVMKYDETIFIEKNRGLTKMDSIRKFLSF